MKYLTDMIINSVICGNGKLNKKQCHLLGLEYDELNWREKIKKRKYPLNIIQALKVARDEL